MLQTHICIAGMWFFFFFSPFQSACVWPSPHSPRFPSVPCSLTGPSLSGPPHQPADAPGRHSHSSAWWPCPGGWSETKGNRTTKHQ